MDGIEDVEVSPRSDEDSRIERLSEPSRLMEGSATVEARSSEVGSSFHKK